MTAPPGVTPTPAGTHSTGPNGATARLSRAALGSAGRELRANGYEPSVPQVVAFAEWRAVHPSASVPEVRDWMDLHVPRKRKLSACDQRVGGPNWRVTT